MRSTNDPRREVEGHPDICRLTFPGRDQTCLSNLGREKNSDIYSEGKEMIKDWFKKRKEMTVQEQNSLFENRVKEAQKNPHWNCRFHPTEWWHEVGCPHKPWTPEELVNAIILHKAVIIAKDEELKWK